jgi:hypothetical protein
MEVQSNTLSDAMYKYTFIHVQAYVVSVDMVLSQEMAFKLTPETIKSLVEYHKDVYMVDQADATWQWTEKEAAIKSMHEEFVQAVNKYVFRTNKIALEGIEDDGSGELLCGQSEEVRNAIMGLFLPLLPPPPKIVEVKAPPPVISATAQWWAPTPPPVESWKVLPSNTPPVLPSNATSPEVLPMSYDFLDTASSGWWSSPQSTPSPQMEPVLPMPMMQMAASCGTSMGFGGFGWENGRFADFATTI